MGPVSSTALLIARHQALAARDPRLAGLVPPAAAEASMALLRECGLPGRWALRQVHWPWLARVVSFFEDRVLPGLRAHFALRKHHVEKVVRREIEAGVRQVVVVGAGLDTLALRLSREHPAVLFAELDRPATQAVKRRALEKGTLLSGPVALVPADLAQESLAAAAARIPGFDRSLPTLYLAEGLTMYLDEAHVRSLLADARPRVLFTFMEPDGAGRLRFGGASPLSNLWLHLQGEPFRWGLPRRRLAGFLEGLGLEVLDCVASEDLPALYLDPPCRTIVGELVALAAG